jgi:peptidoglycan/xylan/chitin deacetylase (PgdA/CDA1 family)
MFMRMATALCVSLIGSAMAAECPGNPNALGTSRVLAVNPVDYPLVGTLDYPETLRLEDREVVLTFDDGPTPPFTDRILETLAAECVRATFFALGINVAESPDLVRRAYDAGHTIGTHTFSHSDLRKLPVEKAYDDVRLGVFVVTTGLGKARQVSPFFRFPYLSSSKELERHLVAQGLMIWSIDVDSGDWHFVTPEKLVEHTIARLEKAGKGILLLHDIQARTAQAMPHLLAELKRRNFRIVHVVPTIERQRDTTGR